MTKMYIGIGTLIGGLLALLVFTYTSQPGGYKDPQQYKWESALAEKICPKAYSNPDVKELAEADLDESLPKEELRRRKMARSVLNMCDKAAIKL